jgi:pilus assembly protein Flp/PilA
MFSIINPRKIFKGRKNSMERFKKFFRDEEGATAVEYGLMVALIAIVIIAAVSLLGTNLSDVFQTVADTVSAS